jgi:type I restriction enzyme S subunit
MKLPAYPKYKSSGVEWLGDVPEHWEVKRLKTSATCWVSNVDKVPAEDELPIRLCNYTDVYYNDHITSDMDLMETTATADEIRRFGLRVGDVVITKDSEEWNDIAVPALVKKTAPDLVCGYHLAIVRSHPKTLLGDYLLRAFQSCAVNQQFQVAASGVTRYGLPKASIGDAWVPLPAPTEQRSIAAFLDRETGRIDQLVAKKQILIERLKEKRTALISRTVTHGLPPAAARAAGISEKPRLRPSNINWLGEIPEHWRVMALKWRSRCYSGDGISTEDVTPGLTSERSVPVIGGNGVMGYCDSSNCDHEVLVIGRVGALCGNVHLVAPPAWVTDNALIMPVDSATFSQKYLAAVLRTRNLNDLADKTAQPLITGTRVRAERVPVPPLPEQAAIAAYLDAETANLDALVGKVEEAVERLQEYRTALITAAVTGKVDGRPNAGKITP